MLVLLPALHPAGISGTPAVTITGRETYDTNVFLQDTAPAPTVNRAAPARQGSLVSVLGANLALTARLPDGGTLTLGYAPEFNRFHSAGSEDFTSHRFTQAYSVQSGVYAIAFQNTLTWIDGPSLSPVFGCPPGAPAMGAGAVRDRRDGVVDRGSLRLTRTFGSWWLRAVGTGFIQDFRSVQSRDPGYLNAIDRGELLAGVDAGRRIAPGTFLVAGWRVGRQQQFSLLGIDSPFDCTLRRFLVGLEGSPRKGITLTLLAGPESRTFAAGTPAGFDRDHVSCWVDASASIALSPRQTLTLALRRQELPASSSRGVYEDSCAEAGWRLQIDARWTANLSLKAVRGDWRSPALRHDRIYSPSISLQRRLTPHDVLEFGWTLDHGDSRVPDTSARDYRRQAISAAFSHTL